MFTQAIVSEDIRDGQFKIKTDKPNVKVSWQVTGVRNDLYARENRIQVEVEKEPEKKGTLLYNPTVSDNKEPVCGIKTGRISWCVVSGFCGSPEGGCGE